MTDTSGSFKINCNDFGVTPVGFGFSGIDTAIDGLLHKTYKEAHICYAYRPGDETFYPFGVIRLVDNTELTVLRVRGGHEEECARGTHADPDLHAAIAVIVDRATVRVDSMMNKMLLKYNMGAFEADQPPIIVCR